MLCTVCLFNVQLTKNASLLDPKIEGKKSAFIFVFTLRSGTGYIARDFNAPHWATSSHVFGVAETVRVKSKCNNHILPLCCFLSRRVCHSYLLRVPLFTALSLEWFYKFCVHGNCLKLFWISVVMRLVFEILYNNNKMNLWRCWTLPALWISSHRLNDVLKSTSIIITFSPGARIYP